MSEDIFSGEDSTVKNKIYDKKGKEIPINDRDSMEDIDKVYTKVEVEASFPGGLQAWQDIFQGQLQGIWMNLK